MSETPQRTLSEPAGEIEMAACWVCCELRVVLPMADGRAAAQSANRRYREHRMGARKAEAVPPVTMGHIGGHDCRDLFGLLYLRAMQSQRDHERRLVRSILVFSKR